MKNLFQGYEIEDNRTPTNSLTNQEKHQHSLFWLIKMTKLLVSINSNNIEDLGWEGRRELGWGG